MPLYQTAVVACCLTRLSLHTLIKPTPQVNPTKSGTQPQIEPHKREINHPATTPFRGEVVVIRTHRASRLTHHRMAPKKKGNKKQDDWESELGETIDPIAAATEAAKEEEAKKDEEEEFGGGGLMAAMKKNRNKKKNKGQPVEDFVEGEDPPGAEPATAEPDLAEKAPVEASIDDEFALPGKKGKGKSASNAPAKAAADEDDEEERGADGKIMSKKEKEKAKKEREKQRKKEQVNS